MKQLKRYGHSALLMAAVLTDTGALVLVTTVAAVCARWLVHWLAPEWSFTTGIAAWLLTTVLLLVATTCVLAAMGLEKMGREEKEGQ